MTVKDVQKKIKEIESLSMEVTKLVDTLVNNDNTIEKDLNDYSNVESASDIIESMADILNDYKKVLQKAIDNAEVNL